MTPNLSQFRRKSHRHSFSVKPAAQAALVAVALLCGGISSRAGAQSATTGAITGTISDASGALLPGTTVTILSAETGFTRTLKANANGEYKIGELAPGTYTVTFSADGFKAYQDANVTVNVGGTASVSPKLIVGASSDKVEVSGQTEDLHTDNNAISTSIDQNAIDNLPINGRRWSDFALLTPGVVSNSDGFGLLSFRGISYLLNNSTVDGADDNQAYFSEARGRTRSAYTVTQGAVQEFQVNTSNYSAEYGRAAGGVINTVTKSGANATHGELYFYDRDNSFGGASNPYTQLYNFDENTGLNLQNVKPKDWRKQYGFGVGGPILKDRVFWFYAFDQSKRNFTGIARTSDPYDMFATATPLSGAEKCTRTADAYGVFDFGAPTFAYTAPDGTVYPGASVTANLSTPTTTGAAGYPIGHTSYEGNYGACALSAALNPNAATGSNLPYQQTSAYYNQGLGVLSTFFGAVPRFGNQIINFPKVDWQVNDRNRMSVQYNRVRWDSPDGVQTQTSNFYGRGSYGNDFVKADVGIFHFSTVVSNSVVNSILVQYGRDMESEFPSKPTPNELPLANSLPTGECSAPHGGPCVASAPDLSVGYGYDAGGFDGGTSALFSRFALPDERRLQFKDDLTWSRGNHTFKFGVDFNKVTDYINNLYNGYGTYDFDWAYSFIGDYLHSTTGLGGTPYAGGGAAQGGDYNFGLYSSFSQGFTVPSNFNLQTFLNTNTASVPGNAGTPDNVGAKSLLATREYAGYATDNWRIKPRLTLTLGVRYEYEYVPANPTPNPDLIGSSATLDGAAFTLAGIKALPNTTTHPDDRNNVQPRIGFSYDVYGTGKTILRGGYGMYFGRIINATIEQSYQNSGGPGSQVNISGLFSDAATANVNVCKIAFPQNVASFAQAYGCALDTANASSHPSVSFLSPHLQNPQVHEVDVALEQDLGHSLILGVTYMASFGRELDSASDVNLNLSTAATYNFFINNTVGISPGVKNPVLPHGGKPAPLTGPTTPVLVYTGSRIDPHYYRILKISSNVNSNYNALAFQLNKRYKNGFSLLSNFTWSHALDFNPYLGTGIPGPSTLDPNNQYKDYGNSSLDVRQRFVLAMVYQPQTNLHGWRDEVLGGWRISPIFQAQSGLPYTPYVAGYPHESASGVRSANGSGGTSGRIDAIRRNQYTDPKTSKLDLRVSKNFYLGNITHLGTDRMRFEILGEAFNIVNHQDITGVQNTAYNLSYGTVNGITPGTTSSAAGTSEDILTLQPNFGTYLNANSNYTYTPRQIQVAVRLHF